jgi:signal transduction histidine kinase
MASDRWHRRAHRRFRHSLKARLVALFLLLALALAAAFLYGMQQALGGAWRGAAQPLVADYADRLAAEIGSPPSIEKAQALAQRLPVTVRISGPRVQWRSNPDSADPRWGPEGRHGVPVLVRTTADGHRIELGVDTGAWRERPQRVGWTTLLVLLLLTALAYAYVRRLLRPLDDIGAGARRFGEGRFAEPIPVRRRDELGQLASGVNAMAESIHQMLEAKRGLLLAISHELRSPLTRARLHTELLPEDGEAGEHRAALLRDLQEMANLVTDLLESERLGQGHAVLQREPTQLEELVREVAHGREVEVEVEIGSGLPTLDLDRMRMRLLLRNLIDNALRHGAGDRTPVVKLEQDADGRAVVLTVRDFGPGVDEAALPQLTEPFWRPDASRERATGGVGLGLYLCTLVVLAHGGRFELRNARPGLEVEVRLEARGSTT